MSATTPSPARTRGPGNKEPVLEVDMVFRPDGDAKQRSGSLMAKKLFTQSQQVTSPSAPPSEQAATSRGSFVARLGKRALIGALAFLLFMYLLTILLTLHLLLLLHILMPLLYFPEL